MQQSAKTISVDLVDLVDETASLSMALSRLVDSDPATGTLANVILEKLEQIQNLVHKSDLELTQKR